MAAAAVVDFFLAIGSSVQVVGVVLHGLLGLGGRRVGAVAVGPGLVPEVVAGTPPAGPGGVGDGVPGLLDVLDHWPSWRPCIMALTWAWSWANCWSRSLSRWSRSRSRWSRSASCCRRSTTSRFSLRLWIFGSSPSR